MSEFRDLADFYDASLRLPWRGKTYVIPPPAADVGLRCQILVNVTTRAVNATEQAERTGDPVEQVELTDHDRGVLTDVEEVELYKGVLGPVWDELFADKAPWPQVKHFAMTAMTYFTVGEEAAMAAWEGPKAPNRETRRAIARTGTAGGTATPSRGSTNGMSSRKGKAPGPAGKPSRGGKSSPSGVS